MYQTLDNLLDGFAPDMTAQDCVHSLAGFAALMRDRKLISPRWPIKQLDDIRIAALRLCILPPEKIKAGFPKCLAFFRERFGDVPAEEVEAMIEAVAENAQAAHGARCWNAALAFVAAEDAIEAAAAAPHN